MKLTDYSEEEIKKLVDVKLTKPNAVRDYKVMSMYESGKSIKEIADTHDISDREVYRILHRYRKTK